MEQKEKKKINLKKSEMDSGFDKQHEFIILKKHVFEIQSVSPKKVILKYKRKLNKTDHIADGIYVFTDGEDKLLLPHKVFTQFDRNAKAKRTAREEK